MRDVIEVPVGGSPLEPICALEGPPCFAHDGRYLGRGPISFEKYLRVGMHRRTGDRRAIWAAIESVDVKEMAEYGVCDAIGKSTAHGDPAYAWKAHNERSTLYLELELVGWRIEKLERFGPNSEPEYRQWSKELKALEAHEKLLREQVEPPPKKKLDPKRLP